MKYLGVQMSIDAQYRNLLPSWFHPAYLTSPTSAWSALKAPLLPYHTSPTQFLSSHLRTVVSAIKTNPEELQWKVGSGSTEKV